jgi:hypothetical protein
MSSTSWHFQVYFNYKDAEGRTYAEDKRNESLVFLTETFERSSRFSVIAKTERDGCLVLTGSVSQRNPCSHLHMKRILGKHSYCKPNVLSDVLNLMRYFNIDKDISVTGTLHRNNDVKFIMKVIHADNARRSETDNSDPPDSETNTLDGDASTVTSDTGDNNALT